MHGAPAVEGPPGESIHSRIAHACLPRFRSLPLIVLLAFGARFAALSLVQPWPIHEGSALWKSGLEIVNIATSIASHRGFSSPFGVPSGPTAWIPPVYPYLVATIFLTLGLRSNLAALAILMLQASFSALTCLPIYSIARRAFDENLAIWASWGWALFPYAIVFPALFIWETTLSGFLLACLCYLCLDLPNSRVSTQIAVGVLWGIAALTNPSLLALLPFFLLCPYVKQPVHPPGKAMAIILVVAAFVVCPWFLRNWHELGAIIPLRSNFGEELWVGNHVGGIGRFQFGLGPSDNQHERERYRYLGEISYAAQRKTEAMQFISENRGQFLRQTFFRVRYWWFAEGEDGGAFLFYRLLAILSLAGIALGWRRIANGPVLTIVMAIVVYPAVYYVTDVFARYRYPVEPFMMILATFAVSQAIILGKARFRKS